MKTIIASGPVIIENGKLLVDKDNKDDFYKLPGGRPQKNEKLEATCNRRSKEEIDAEIKITKPLNPMIIWQEEQTIILIHYQAKLLNKEDIKPIGPIREVKWLDIEEIKQNKHNIAPNIKFLIEKGDIK